MKHFVTYTSLLFLLMPFQMLSQIAQDVAVCENFTLLLNEETEVLDEDLQWQYFDGINWENLIEGTDTVGTTSSELSFINVQGEMDGDSIRCVAWSQVTGLQDSLIGLYFINVLPELLPQELTHISDSLFHLCEASNVDVMSEVAWTTDQNYLNARWEKSIDGSWVTTDEINIDSYIEHDVNQSFDLYQILYSETAQCPFVYSDTLEFTVDPIPSVFAGSDTSFCYQTTSYTLQGFSPGLSENGIGDFYGIGDAELAVSSIGVIDLLLLSPGTYSVVYFFNDSITSCSNSDTLNFTKLPELIAPIINNEYNLTPLCYDASPGLIIETSSAIGADGNFDIQWYSEGQGASPIAVGFNSSSYSAPNLTDTTLYFAEYTSTYGCGTVTSNTVLIDVLPDFEFPNLLPSIDGDVCYGYDLTIDALGFDTHSWLEYQWVEHPSDGVSQLIGDGSLSMGFTSLTEDFGVSFDITSTYDCGVMSSDVMYVNVLNELVAPIISDNINGDPICYDFSPGNLSISNEATGGSESFTYEWGVYEDEWNDGLFVGEDYPIGTLQSTQLYHCIAIDVLCGSITSNDLTIDVLPELQDPIIFNEFDTESICYSTNPGTIIETQPATGGDNNFDIQWYSVSEDGVPSPVGDNVILYVTTDITDTTSYFAEYTSTYGCGTVTSNTVLIDVLPDFEFPNLLPSIDGDVCYGYDLTVDALGFDTHSWLEYQWVEHPYDGESQLIGDGSLSIDFTSLTEDFGVSFDITSTYDCGVMSSDVMYVNVLNELVAPIISDNINGDPICYDFSPGNLSISTEATGGSESFTYEWGVYEDEWNDGLFVGEDYPIGTLQSTQLYHCIAINDLCGSITSNDLTIDVLPELQEPIIFNEFDTESICYNTNPGTIIENQPATGGDDNFDIQWYSVSEDGVPSPVGDNVILYVTTDITDTTSYFAEYTSAYGCGTVTSNTVLIDVLPDFEFPNLLPSIDGDVCYGYDLTIDALGFDTHSWLEYQWVEHPYDGESQFIGDGETALDLVYLTDSTVISFDITSTYDCGVMSSDVMYVNVLNQLVAPIVSDSIGGMPICYDTSPGTISVITGATGGSESFTYQWGILDDEWMEGLESGFELSIGNLQSTQVYHCIAYDILCQSITSDDLLMVVYAELSSPTSEMFNAEVLCPENEGVDIQHINQPTGGGDSYEYQWYWIDENDLNTNIIGENGPSLFLPELDHSTVFYQEVTSTYGCGTVIEGEFVVEVLPVVVEPVIDFDESTMPLCFGFEAPPVNLITPPSGADNAWYYTWQASYSGGPFNVVSTSIDPLLMGSQIESYDVFGRAISPYGCGAYNSDTLSIDVLDEIIPGTITDEQLICYNTLPSTLLSSSPTGADGDFNINWYEFLDSGDSLLLSSVNYTQDLPQLTDSTQYVALYTSLYGCGDVVSNIAYVNVLPDLEIPTLIPDIYGSICFDSSIVFSAAGITDYPWLTYQWNQQYDGQDYEEVGEDELMLQLDELIDNFSVTLDVTSDYNCGTITGEFLNIDVLNQLISPTIDFQVTPDNPVCFGFEAPLIELITPSSGGGETFTSTWNMSLSSPDNFVSQNNSSPEFIGSLYITDDLYIQYISSDDFGCGSLTSNTIYIEVFDEFLVDLQPMPSTVCDNEIISDTYVGVSGAGNEYTFEWHISNDGAWDVISGELTNELSNYDPLATNDYFVQIQSDYECGILNSDTFSVVVLEPVVPGDLEFEDLVLCATETLSFNATQANGGTGLFDLFWHQTDNYGEWQQIGSTLLNDYVEDVQFSFSGYIQYVNTCDIVNSDTVNLIVNPLPLNPELFGQILVCNNSTDNYYEVNMPLGPWLYDWDITNGVISSGETVNEVLVDWDDGEIFSSLDLSITNSETDCISNNTWEIEVTDISAPPPSLVIKKPLINILVSSDSTDCATYQWGREGANNGYIEMFEDRIEQYAFFPNLDTVNHHYFVDIIYDCDAIETCPTRNYYLHDPFLSINTSDEDELNLVVYPNPNNGLVSVILPMSSYWSLINMSGKVVQSGFNNSDTSIELVINTPGLYLFQAEANSKIYNSKILTIH